MMLNQNKQLLFTSSHRAGLLLPLLLQLEQQDRRIDECLEGYYKHDLTFMSFL